MAYAGFLEMPDMTEPSEAGSEDMLLDLEIPRVSERYIHVEEGPRVNLNAFRVQGIVEYPELGITLESLNTFVESLRVDLMGENKIHESGFTDEEITETMKLVAEISKETQDEPVTHLDLQRLVFLVNDQKLRRGVTIGMIETVADSLTQYYRERGFILAKAYIPKQSVRDGVVTITLLLGNLGELKFSNSKRYSEKLMGRILKPIMNKPVQKSEVEEQLYYLNDLPGLSLQPYFEPGSQVGDTRLNLHVRREELLRTNVRVDNHGSESTGNKRLYADVSWNNPLGMGDQLYLGALGTFEPSDSAYGAFNYSLPFWNGRGRYKFGASTNDFESRSINGLTVVGRSKVVDLSLNYFIKRSREANYSVGARVSEITTAIEDNDTNSLSTLDDSIRNFDLSFAYDVLWFKFKSVHQGNLGLTYGEYVEGQKIGDEESPLLLTFDHSFQSFFNLPFTNYETKMQFKFSGQYSEKILPSVSQFSLGGPQRMRGLAVNEFNVDSGAYTSVDLLFRLPKLKGLSINGVKLSNLIQPYVFFEGAYGQILSFASSFSAGDNLSIPKKGTWGKMSDVGVGLRFSYKNVFSANVSAAYVLSNRKDFGNGVRHGIGHVESRSTLYANAQYHF